jgi:dsDNA-specific endonuclease/ATPase MutS2
VPKHPNRQPQFDSRDDLLDGAAATLDLHGRTADEARAMVQAFLLVEARSSRRRVVHIITGKGKGSQSGAVLRPLIAAELRGACAPFVADWSRDTDDGGYVVRLR